MLNSDQQQIQWKGTAFKKMKNLRILIVRNACFSRGPKYLPNNLRFLEWEQYPLMSLPSSFDPRKLVVLKMPHSCLKLEKSLEIFKYVSVLNFSYCQFIIEVPDMSGFPILKKLDLSHCENLVKVHDSVGFLAKVTDLHLSYCKNLRSLPSAIQMASLEGFYVNDCPSLEHFPDILGNMHYLLEIDASNTAVKELPNSIGNLTGLEVLILSRSNLISLPGCLNKLSKLSFLNVAGCKKFQEIYDIPSNLYRVNAEGCTSLTLQSASVLMSQAIKKIDRMVIVVAGAHIPDWFDYRCKGGVISFWARKKLPDAAFAFIFRIFGSLYFLPTLYLFINGVEVRNNISWRCIEQRGSHVFLRDLNALCGRELGLESYLVHEWNYVEIKVKRHPSQNPNIAIDQCGIYVYKEGTIMEDVRFECPDAIMST